MKWPSALQAALVLLALAPIVAATPPSGVRARLARRGDAVIDELNPGQLVTPGSVQKLLVAAGAFHWLGADYRFRTVLSSEESPRADGVLDGDLVVRPAGDPTWNARFFPDDPGDPLKKLAGRLRAHGVRRVTGDLVVDLGSFGGRSYPLSRPLSEVSFGWGAPPAAMVVDEGTFEVRVRPGPRVGAPVAAEVSERRRDVRLLVRAVTVSAELDRRGSLEAIPWWGENSILLRGEYPISEPAYTLALASPSPVRDAANELGRALKEAGVEVEGAVRLGGGSAATVELAILESPPLSEIAAVLLTESVNSYAGMLGLALGREIEGEGRFDAGLRVVSRFLLEEVGIPKGEVVLDDFSGLSPYNLVTPRAVVQLLQWTQGQPWHRGFREALASGREGTLEGWPALPTGSTVKTGTIRGTLALAGFTEVGEGELLAFAAFVNHDASARDRLRRELVGWVRGLRNLARRPSSAGAAE